MQLAFQIAMDGMSVDDEKHWLILATPVSTEEHLMDLLGCIVVKHSLIQVRGLSLATPHQHFLI